MSIRVAVASSDGKFINQHFGHAEQFLIFDIHSNGKYEFVELRKNNPSCIGGEHTNSGIEDTVKIIKDTQIVLVSQIGQGALQVLLNNHIQPIMMPTFIDEALENLSSKIVNLNDDLKK